MVVSRESGILEILGLVLIDHAQGHAHLHVQLADARDHRLDVLQTGLPTPHVPPGGTHAEPSAAVGFGVAGFLQHVLDGRHLGGLEAGVVARGLRTVGAVLAAPAGLDVHQGAHLDGGGVVEAAVDGGLSGLVMQPFSLMEVVITYSSISQLVQRRLVDLLDLVPGPGGARGRRSSGLLQGNGDATGQSTGTGGRLNSAIGPDEPGHEAGGHCLV